MNSRPVNLAKALSRPRIRTLVVDDSPLMLRILTQILGDAGNFDLIATAIDGRQALRHVAALSPELVIMDLHLPHLTGIQATRYIKEFKQPPIVIIVTADDSPAAKSMAEKAGADAFILKAGNLRHRLLGALQELFGPGGGRRAAANRDLSPQNLPAGRATQERGT